MRGLDRFRGERVGVLGMARSGLAAARALRAAGALVTAYDDRPEALARAAAALGVPAGRAGDVGDLSLLLASPGVPLTHPRPHPLVAAAQAAGVPVRGDVDLFAEAAAPRPVVGVTGTNGKSTTTALLHHLLASAGVDAVRGGNIGEPVFDLDLGSPGRVLVLELSSYQLDLADDRLRCRVAVWLNLSPDHLDRHGDLAGYVRAKRRILAGQREGDAAVVGVDDAPSRDVADGLAAAGRRVLRISAGAVPDGGVGVRDGILADGTESGGRAARDVLDLRPLDRLRGRHNHQNAAAAYAAARALGLGPDEAARGFATFAGLPHRLEEVARAGGVAFVNDSKATNPDATARALESFADVFWIAGGRPKPGGFAGLRPHLGSVRRAYLIGEAAEEIARDVGDLVPVERSGTLDVAVAAATEAAAASGLPGAAVLLAPACASFDQFASFEARGDAFRAFAARAAAGAVAGTTAGGVA